MIVRQAFLYRGQKTKMPSDQSAPVSENHETAGLGQRCARADRAVIITAARSDCNSIIVTYAF